MSNAEIEQNAIGRAEMDFKSRTKAALKRPSAWKSFVIATYFIYSFNYLFLFICAVIFFDRVTALNEHCNDLNKDECHMDATCHYKDLRENSCVLGQPDFDFFLFIMGSWTLNTVNHLIKTYLAFKNLYRHRRANKPQTLSQTFNTDTEAALEGTIVGGSVNGSGSSSSSSSSRPVDLRVTRSDSFNSLPGAINRAETGKYQSYTTVAMFCILPAVWKDWNTEEWGFSNRGQSRFCLMADFLLDGLCGFIAAIGYLTINFITKPVPAGVAGIAMLCSLSILIFTTVSLFHWIRAVRYWGPVVA